MLRMPAHPVALDLLRAAGPIARSSANRTGRPPATTVGQARDHLGDSVGVYLDGGPTGNAPSTVVGLPADGAAAVLRAGAVPTAEVARVLDGSGTEVRDGPGTRIPDGPCTRVPDGPCTRLTPGPPA